MSDYLGEVGFFQLMNLKENRIDFNLFKIGFKPAGDIPAALQGILQIGIEISQDQALNQIKSQLVDKMAPVVLLCSDGKSSSKIANTMISEGYFNVFIVTGGLAKLIKESGG